MMAFFIPEDLPEAYAWLPDSWNTLVDRIAELEAELTLSRQQTEYANEALKAALDRDYEAREELAALKGRRCETCASGESQGDIIQLVLCRAVGRFSATNTLVAPFTHSCSWWTAREATP